MAVEVLSAGRVKILDHGLRVGRLDSIAPAPEGQLLPENADLDAWAIFWKARGFNLTEAMALMGSHALIDEQVRGCGTFGGSRTGRTKTPACRAAGSCRARAWPYARRPGNRCPQAISACGPALIILRPVSQPLQGQQLPLCHWRLLITVFV